jgi:hypothetical protein
MRALLFLISLILSHVSVVGVESITLINDRCPFSSKSADRSQFLSYGVCCGNCLKKVSKDVLGFVKNTKPNNKTCSFSAKPARKFFKIGFCCSKCKKKAS